MMRVNGLKFLQRKFRWTSGKIYSQIEWSGATQQGGRVTASGDVQEIFGCHTEEHGQ